MSHRAGFWLRTLAAAIDLVAMVPVVVVALMVMDAAWDEFGPERAEWMASLILYGAWVLYSTLEIWTAGTPGKLALGLRIMSADGSAADFWRKFLRWSAKHLPFISAVLWMLTGFVPLYLLSGFSALAVLTGCLFAANDDHLAWHDQWSGTAVFRRPKASVPPTPPSVDTPTTLA